MSVYLTQSIQELSWSTMEEDVWNWSACFGFSKIYDPPSTPIQIPNSIPNHLSLPWWRFIVYSLLVNSIVLDAIGQEHDFGSTCQIKEIICLTFSVFLPGTFLQVWSGMYQGRSAGSDALPWFLINYSTSIHLLPEPDSAGYSFSMANGHADIRDREFRHYGYHQPWDSSL